MSYEEKKEAGYIVYTRYIRPEWKKDMDIIFMELKLKELKEGYKPLEKSELNYNRKIIIVFEYIKRNYFKKNKPIKRWEIANKLRYICKEDLQNILKFLCDNQQILQTEIFYNNKISYSYEPNTIKNPA